jgi:hypothetical protein
MRYLYHRSRRANRSAFVAAFTDALDDGEFAEQRQLIFISKLFAATFAEYVVFVVRQFCGE